MDLRSRAKGLAYDLASFTWPGWAEPGIEITASELAIGREAAFTNLRLARELQKGDLPLSRAHWLLGAHHLAVARWNAARESFEAAAAHARSAGAPAEELLALGFSRMAAALFSPANANVAHELAAIKARLAGIENGSAFIEQIEMAWRVFCG